MKSSIKPPTSERIATRGQKKVAKLQKKAEIAKASGKSFKSSVMSSRAALKNARTQGLAAAAKKSETEKAAKKASKKTSSKLMTPEKLDKRRTKRTLGAVIGGAAATAAKLYKSRVKLE
jgi:hypothetical protein